MKHLILICFAMLSLGMTTNAWSWTGVDGYLDNSGFVTQCYVTTAASDASAADEDENQTGENSEEEEPDCD